VLPILGRTRPLRWVNKIAKIQQQADILHHTFYEPRYLRSTATPDVRAVTVYDMIPELFPNLFPHSNPHLAKKEFIAAADLILCISECTKRDLCRMYGVPEDRVRVTPLAASAAFSERQSPPTWAPEQYVLFVGQRSGYKNFECLVRAFAVADLPSKVQLVVVGGGHLTASETALLHELRLADRVHHRVVSDREMPAVYSGARCFVFPSLYEGFGLPTLEAMASGCPTVLANTSSHPEVGGEAAAYFDPRNFETLASHLASITAKPEIRDAMIRAGYTNADKFSWSKTARLTADAYTDASGTAR
jgi:glycosyltransferase involved in cell wall biosynthesis